jgi:hypothetical protein
MYFQIDVILNMELGQRMIYTFCNKVTQSLGIA